MDSGPDRSVVERVDGWWKSLPTHTRWFGRGTLVALAGVTQDFAPFIRYCALWLGAIFAFLFILTAWVREAQASKQKPKNNSKVEKTIAVKWLATFAVLIFIVVNTVLYRIKHPLGDQDTTQIPYVSVSDAGTTVKDSDGIPTVYVVIKNSGAGPAYGLTWRAAFAVREFPNFGALELKNDNFAPSVDLAPGGTRFYEWKVDRWSPNNWKLLTAGKIAMFGYGEILYKDTKDSQVIRCIQYRLYNGGDSLVSKDKFAIAREGNFTDNGCTK